MESDKNLMQQQPKRDIVLSMFSRERLSGKLYPAGLCPRASLFVVNTDKTKMRVKLAFEGLWRNRFDICLPDGRWMSFKHDADDEPHTCHTNSSFFFHDSRAFRDMARGKLRIYTREGIQLIQENGHDVYWALGDIQENQLTDISIFGLHAFMSTLECFPAAWLYPGKPGNYVRTRGVRNIDQFQYVPDDEERFRMEPALACNYTLYNVVGSRTMKNYDGTSNDTHQYSYNDEQPIGYDTSTDESNTTTVPSDEDVFQGGGSSTSATSNQQRENVSRVTYGDAPE